MSLVRKWHLRTTFLGGLLPPQKHLTYAFEAATASLSPPLQSSPLSAPRPQPSSLTCSLNCNPLAELTRMQGLDRLFGRGRSSSSGRGPRVDFGGEHGFTGRSFFSRSVDREPEAPPASQWFKLADDCLLGLHKGDITKWFVDMKSDGIVNAANEFCLGGGGVDGAIHDAAGKELYYACKELPLVRPGVRCPTGEAVITLGFRLPARTVIHTVGPWYRGKERSAPLLESAYRNSILLAAERGLKYLAFPAISCGVYGYPYDEGAEVALSTCKEHADKLKEIHFVLFDRPVWNAWLNAAQDLNLPRIEVDEEARKGVQRRAVEGRRNAERQQALERAREAGGVRQPGEEQLPAGGGKRSETRAGLAALLGDEDGGKKEWKGVGGRGVQKGETRKDAGSDMWAVDSELGSEKDEGDAPGGWEKEEKATGWGSRFTSGRMAKASSEDMQGGDKNDEPNVEGFPDEKVMSPNDSFQTGEEEFADDSGMEEGTEGKAMKRVRSEDADGDALDNDSQDGLPNQRDRKSGVTQASRSSEESKGVTGPIGKEGKESGEDEEEKKVAFKGEVSTADAEASRDVQEEGRDEEKKRQGWR